MGRNLEHRKEYMRLYRIRTREKRREDLAKWRAENPERVKHYHETSQKAYRERNRETLRAYNAQYNQEHREEKRGNKRRWAEAHPERARQQSRNHDMRRRAKEAETNYQPLSPEEREALLAPGCFFCGSREDLSVAHDTPVVKGGDTVLPNLLCLCRSCNSQMGIRSLPEVIEQTPLPL